MHARTHSRTPASTPARTYAHASAHAHARTLFAGGRRQGWRRGNLSYSAGASKSRSPTPSRPHSLLLGYGNAGGGWKGRRVGGRRRKCGKFAPQAATASGASRRRHLTAWNDPELRQLRQARPCPTTSCNPMDGPPGECRPLRNNKRTSRWRATKLFPTIPTKCQTRGGPLAWQEQASRPLREVTQGHSSESHSATSHSNRAQNHPLQTRLIQRSDARRRARLLCA